MEQRSARFPLRQKSPYNKEFSSPRRIASPDNEFRNSSELQICGDSLSEEARQEELRGDEIRRKIQQREHELQHLAQNKNRLIYKIQNTLYAPEASQQELYKNEFSFDNRVNPLSLPIERASFDTEHQYHSSAQEKYINQIFHDNQQLIKRINLLAQDLDKVKKDRHNLVQRHQFLSLEIQNLQGILTDGDKQEIHFHHEIQKHREQNRIFEHKAETLDFDRVNVFQNLNKIQSQKQNCQKQIDDLNMNLIQKQEIFQELQTEVLLNQKKIEFSSTTIKSIQVGIKHDFTLTHEISCVIGKLKQERAELVFRLKHLQDTYDHAIKEGSQEKLHFKVHSKRHLQLMSAKVIFQIIQRLKNSKQQNIVNDFKTYCKFDRACYSSLKGLAAILQQTGRHKLQYGLKKWFENCYQPVQLKDNNHVLTDKHYNQKLSQKMFFLWRKKMSKISKSQKKQIQGAEMIFRLKSIDTYKEMVRIVKIWRDMTKLTLLKRRALEKVFLRQTFNLKRQILHHWRVYNIELAAAISEHILATEFSTDQLMTVTMNQLKIRIKTIKRIRQMRLAHILKAWQDWRAYSKFLLSSNLLVLKFRKDLNLKLLNDCFHAIQFCNQKDAYQVVHNHVQIILPQITEQQIEIENIATKALLDLKIKRCNVLKTMILVKVNSYFQNWKSLLSQHQNIEKKLKVLTLIKYKQLLHLAVSFWKKGKFFYIIYKQEASIINFSKQGQKLQTDLSFLRDQISCETERQKKLQRSSLQKSILMYNGRSLQQGSKKWNDRCYQLTDMEQAAFKIMTIFRTHLCRNTLKSYKKSILEIKQQERNNIKCNYFIQRIQLKQKNLKFNAILQFVQKFSKARDSFGVLLNKCDIWILKRSVKLWIQQGNQKQICNLQSQQNLHSQKFDQKNVELGIAVKQREVACQFNTEIKRKLTDQARRVLSNAFVRFYYIKAERGMKKWIDFSKHQKHLATLIKRAIIHQFKNQFNQVKSRFQNWIANAKRQQLNQSIAKEDYRTKEGQQMIDNNLLKHIAESKQYQNSILSHKNQSDILQNKYNKKIENIIRKNRDNYYQSAKRYIFVQWSQFTKRQVKFIKAIDKIITKSLSQQGFSNISAFSWDKQLTRDQNRAADGMSRMYFKKLFGRALKTWRENSYQYAVCIKKSCEQQKKIEQKRQAKWVNKVQDYNGLKGENHLRKTNLLNALQAWKNVHTWFKSSREKQKSYKKLQIALQARLSLKKWFCLSSITIKYRKQTRYFKSKQRLMYLKSCFKQLKQKFGFQKSFIFSLSNFSSKCNFNEKQRAFNMIYNFILSKDATQIQQKKIAASDFSSILHQLYKRKLSSYLSHFRSKNKAFQKLLSKFSVVIGHFKSVSLRDQFMKWKFQHNKQKVCDEVNEDGPIIAQVLKAQMEYSNYKNFLRDQGYIKEEQNSILAWANKRQKELLSKVISRLQLNSRKNDKSKLDYLSNDDVQYLKPRIFDKWKMFVKFRKLFRYLLRNLENRLHPTKSDISLAFTRWKYHKWHIICGMDIGYLCDRSDNNARKLKYLDEIEGQAQQVLLELAITRDELVESLVSSQRIAIGVGRNNLQRSMHKSVLKMQEQSHKIQRSNFEQILADRIDLIKKFKERILDIEQDNDSLAVENEELRQFSLDGYTIAKNLKTLHRETEILSVDLADKTTTISKLLDQNEALQRKLRNVQEYSIHMIQQFQSDQNRQNAASGRY